MNSDSQLRRQEACKVVILQIKGSEAYNTLQANILPLHKPWGEVNTSNNHFLKLVVLLNKLKGMKGRTK